MTSRSTATPDRPLTDEELLALLQEAEAAQEQVEATVEEVEEPPSTPVDELEGEPCPACGEVAQSLGDCVTCEMQGCLPRDDWHPGISDPCLTRCERCALLVHRHCATQPDDDFNINPRCHLCAGRY